MGRRVLRRGSRKGLSRRHLEGRSTPFREYDPLGVCLNLCPDDPEGTHNLFHPARPGRSCHNSSTLLGKRLCTPLCERCTTNMVTRSVASISPCVANPPNPPLTRKWAEHCFESTISEEIERELIELCANHGEFHEKLGEFALTHERLRGTQIGESQKNSLSSVFETALSETVRCHDPGPSSGTE